jgi:hypothetical protein
MARLAKGLAAPPWRGATGGGIGSVFLARDFEFILSFIAFDSAQ